MIVQNYKVSGSGMLCVLDSNEKQTDVNSVAMSIVVKVGSRYETLEENGISHFLEHMAFKGTSTKTAKQIAETFDDIGGSFNAYTSRSHTVYHGKVLKEDFTILAEILSEIVSDMALDESEIDKERNVIDQEISMYQDMPDEWITDKMMEACYPNQSFGRFIIGSRERIHSFTREDFQKYVKKYYFAENMMVIVSGNLSYDNFTNVMDKYFSNFVSQPKASCTTESAIFHPGIFRQEKDLDQLHCCITFPGVSYLSDSYRIADLLSIILSGGMSSRLFQRIREELGLCYGISFSNLCFSDTGMFVMQTGVAPENINKAIDNIAIELHKIIDDLQEFELIRAIKQFVAALSMAMESNTFKLRYIKNCYEIYGQYVPIEDIFIKIKEISVTNIKDMMRNVLQQRKVSVSLLGKLDNVYSCEEISNKFII